MLMPRCSSISSLRPTFSSTSVRQPRLRGLPTQLWWKPVNSAGQIATMVPGARHLGALPKPRDGDDWRVLAERLGDEIGSAPTIVALDGPWVDAAELELIDRLVRHESSTSWLAQAHQVPGSARSPPQWVVHVRCVMTGCASNSIRSGARFLRNLRWTPRRLPQRTLTKLAAAEVARQITNAAPHDEVAAFNRF